MKIAVSIKHVPVSSDVSVDPVTHALIRENAEGMVNPADLNALEQAIALKESTGATVTAFSMGPADAEKSLRTALAMGCDEAVLVTDRAFAGADTVATARVLASALAHCGGFDLILAGNQTSDGATGQVGPMLAALLDIPHISDACSLTYDAAAPKTIEAAARRGTSETRLAAELPALVTMSFGCNQPRLTTLRAKLAANKKGLGRCTNAELRLDPSTVGLEGSPTEVVDSFEPERSRRAELLGGSAEEIARALLGLIAREKGKC